MKDKSRIFSSKGYLSNYYDPQKKPFTEYPLALARQLTKNFFSRPGTILDVGCGRGEMLHAFTACGHQVKGIDLSPESKNFVDNQLLKIVDLEQERFPFDDRSYDYVFSKSVIEHLDEPLHSIEESYRVLRKGGKCIFMTPSWVHNAWGPFYIDHTHVTPFTRHSLEKILILAGFKNVSVEYFHQLPFTWGSKYLSLVPKMISMLPIKYSPMDHVNWPPGFNKLIRFSKEVMLLGVGTKEDGAINEKYNRNNAGKAYR